MKNIELIKEEILNFDKNDVFYKDNSFEEACYKLTCAFENDFLETTTSLFLRERPIMYHRIKIISGTRIGSL